MSKYLTMKNRNTHLLSIPSVGYSKKGWITGEIGCHYIEDFDKNTAVRAKGQY